MLAQCSAQANFFLQKFPTTIFFPFQNMITLIIYWKTYFLTINGPLEYEKR